MKFIRICKIHLHEFHSANTVSALIAFGKLVINGALTHAYLHFMVVSFVALHLLHQEMLPFLSE